MVPVFENASNTSSLTPSLSPQRKALQTSSSCPDKTEPKR